MKTLKHFYQTGEIKEITSSARKNEWLVRVLLDDGSTVDVIHWEPDPWLGITVQNGDRVMVDYVYLDEIYAHDEDDSAEPIVSLVTRQTLTKISN